MSCGCVTAGTTQASGGPWLRTHMARVLSIRIVVLFYRLRRFAAFLAARKGWLKVSGEVAAGVQSPPPHGVSSGGVPPSGPGGDSKAKGPSDPSDVRAFHHLSAVQISLLQMNFQKEGEFCKKRWKRLKSSDPRLGAERMETFELLLEAYRASKPDLSSGNVQMSPFLTWLQTSPSQASQAPKEHGLKRCGSSQEALCLTRSIWHSRTVGMKSRGSWMPWHTAA